MSNPKIYTKEIYKPTLEDKKLSIEKIKECKRLGLPYNRFDDENLSKDETIALLAIMANKKVPEDIEKRLLETKKDRLKNQSTVGIESN